MIQRPRFEKTGPRSPDDFVSFACAALQPGSLHHRDVAAPVADVAGTLQTSCGVRNALAAHPQHARDQFRRDDKFARLHSVERRQQPAAERLLYGVIPVAGRRLHGLRYQSLRVAQGQALHRPGMIELIHRRAVAEPIGVALRLQDRRARCGVAS